MIIMLGRIALRSMSYTSVTRVISGTGVIRVGRITNNNIQAMKLIFEGVNSRNMLILLVAASIVIVIVEVSFIVTVTVVAIMTPRVAIATV